MAWRFVRRELGNRFVGSFSGALWALIQPLLQLAVTSFVFVYVFRVRISSAGDISSYVAFLAVALWPWTAFAEAVQRATLSIQENAALIGKVALPREILVFASVAASFLIHLAGFVAIVLILAVAGQGIRLAGLLPAILLYVPLMALATGIALASAAIQVFVRDLAQALTQLLPLLMFCAPVYYDRALLPERFRSLLDLNPFTFYAESMHALLLGHGTIAFPRLLIALAVASLVLLLGHWLFHRLDPHFEDFL